MKGRKEHAFSMQQKAPEPIVKARPTVKCVVWDLDNTIWRGTLLEDDVVQMRPEVAEIISTLDARGILHSIASKNEYARAEQQLKAFGLWEYFIYPQINWNSKVTSLMEIARLININLNTIAFVDDLLFEREEVRYSLPMVRCLDSACLDQMLALPDMIPAFITEDSRRRRHMYQSDMLRKVAEAEFVGSSEEFLATLEMELKIDLAQEEDLRRAEELTVRTHQLNTTGYTYSYDELHSFLFSKDHRLLMASLNDRYGTYGKVGLMLLACEPEVWTIKLMLMSCRVMSRGVGTMMINAIMQLAEQAGVRLQAEFVSNDRNRIMYITYKFAGFREVGRQGEISLLENGLSHIYDFPAYVQVQVGLTTEQLVVQIE